MITSEHLRIQMNEPSLIICIVLTEDTYEIQESTEETC